MSEQTWSIKGKTALITGAGAGIGRITAIELTKRGLSKLIIADINTVWGDEVADEIRKILPNCNVVVKYVDISSLESVRKFAEEILETEPQLQLLINNAGINPPADRMVTNDGFEMTFATNYLGHFLLTNLLMPLLKKSQPSRIIAMASDAYLCCWPKGIRLDDLQIERRRFSFWDAYCQSKLAILLEMRHLAKTLRQENFDIYTFSVNPGFVCTDILKNRSKLWQFFVNKIVHPLKFIVISPRKGAKTPIFCACKPGIEQFSGKYFYKCRPSYVLPFAKDEVKCAKLWEISLQYCESSSLMASNDNKAKEEF